MTTRRLREDRISSLPESVREHILQFLPLKDAGKASLLSSEWRNLWMNLPTLKFDQEFDTEEFDSEGKDDVKKLMLDICRVLLLHREPLKEIRLSLAVLEDFPDKLDEILLFLQNKRSIETLAIADEGRYVRDTYKLSKRLFSSYFSQLKTLHLSFCEVESSTNLFQGFVKLTVLELDSVLFRGCGRLSFRCPFLESLSLRYCEFCNYSELRLIEIEAPKLCCFHLVATHCSLHSKHTPRLKMATIPADCFLGCSSDLLKVWGGLTSVESLSVCDFHELLGQAIDQSNDVSPLEMLRHMTLSNLCLSAQSHVYSLLLMITSSPNLQRLEVTMHHVKRKTSASVISFDGPSKFELSQLRKVEVKGLKELNGFARPSTKALIKIESLDHN